MKTRLPGSSACRSNKIEVIPAGEVLLLSHIGGGTFGEGASMWPLNAEPAVPPCLAAVTQCMREGGRQAHLRANCEWVCSTPSCCCDCPLSACARLQATRTVGGGMSLTWLSSASTL